MSTEKKWETALAFFENPPSVLTSGNKAMIQSFKLFLSKRMKGGISAQRYAHSLMRFFPWCMKQQLSIEKVQHSNLVTYRDSLDDEFGSASVNAQLSGIRTFFDWLMTEGCVPANPAASVRSKQKTSVEIGSSQNSDDVTHLLSFVDVSSSEGLRDRAILGVLTHGLMKTSDVVRLNRADYLLEEKTWWFVLGKGSKSSRKIPANAELASYMQEYLVTLKHYEPEAPLFVSMRTNGKSVPGDRMVSRTIQRIVERWTKRASLDGDITPRSLRATSLRGFLREGGRVEKAQRIVGHSSIITTGAYLEKGSQETIYEGDLDGLLALLSTSGTNPLGEFATRSGIFRLTLESNESLDDD